MKRVLIVVDDTKTSKTVMSTFHNSVWKPESVILLYVIRLEGRSLMIDMLSEAELSTLKESLEGTEHKEALDKKAVKILTHYKEKLQVDGSFSVKTVVRAGHQAEEILKVADQEKADLILIGSDRRKGLNRLLTGSVADDVQKSANIPVLVANKPIMCEEPYSWKDAYAAATVTILIVLAMLLVGAFL